jgi:hypothetical protein
MRHDEIAALAKQYERVDEDVATILYALARAKATDDEDRLMEIVVDFIHKLDNELPNRRN